MENIEGLLAWLKVIGIFVGVGGVFYKSGQIQTEIKHIGDQLQAHLIQSETIQERATADRLKLARHDERLDDHERRIVTLEDPV